jgi:hypothetical protein
VGYLYGNGAGAATASTTLPAASLLGVVAVTNGGTGSSSVSGALAAFGLSTSGGAGLVGTSDGTVQSDLNARPTSATLAASGGAGLVGYSQGASGSVSRTVTSKLQESVSVLDFGADPTGAADSTAAFQNALNSVSASGGIVWGAPGSFKVGALTMPSGVSLRGTYYSTLLASSATATILTTGSANLIEGWQFASASGAQTAGSYINVQGSGVTVRDCEIKQNYIGISVGTSGGLEAINFTARNLNFFSPNVAAGGGGILLNNFGSATLDTVIMSGPLSGTQPDFGVRVINGDTAYMSNCNITHYGYALDLSTPSAQNVYSFEAANCDFDSGDTNASGSSCSSANIEPNGGVYNTLFSNCWFGLSKVNSGCTVSPQGSGVVDGIAFTGCQFPANAGDGLTVVGTSAKNWIVTGGFAGGNTNNGLRAANGTSNFTITGFVSGNASGRGSNSYGIKVDAAASNNYLIANNNVIGNTTAGILDQGTGTSAQVYQNLGYNGLSPMAGVTPGASPWTYTNLHTPALIYLSGTISSISIDGNSLASQNNVEWTLAPNESITITYTGTLYAFVKTL